MVHNYKYIIIKRIENLTVLQNNGIISLSMMNKITSILLRPLFYDFFEYILQNLCTII